MFIDFSLVVEDRFNNEVLMICTKTLGLLTTSSTTCSELSVFFCILHVGRPTAGEGFVSRVALMFTYAEILLSVGLYLMVS